MVVRTISQLPTANGSEIAAKSDNTYVEVSLPVDSNNFTSRKTSIRDLNGVATGELSGKMVKDYDMNSPNGTRISLSSESERTTSILEKDITIEGYKKFGKFPYVTTTFPSKDDITSNYGNVDNIIPNIKKVKDLVSETPVFVSTPNSLVAECDNGAPFKTFRGAADDYTGSSICYREFQSSENFYYWRIADGKKDSSETIYDNIDGSQKHFVEIRDTGYLVVWGWLTDGGSVQADMAWVGLFGRMKYRKNDTSMATVPLQIQPWIQGSKSTDMQYVGFGLPVRAGLQLNIRTGFPVAGGSNGAFQRPGSMTFQDGWIPNSFVGYVIKNQE